MLEAIVGKIVERGLHAEYLLEYEPEALLGPLASFFETCLATPGQAAPRPAAAPEITDSPSRS